MAAVSNNATLGDLDMLCQCSPVPIVPAGAVHEVNLHNTGYDRYINTKLAVTVAKPGPARSLSIPASALPSGLGPIPSGQKVSWPVRIQRVVGGHHQHETIRSVVSFRSDAEDEALDDQEKPVHICTCDLDVQVV
jgi:hypothetical protein